ncbi:MAG: hypothetical protein ACM3UR_12730 [Bacteroidota bacterium]|jgi:hypothetical protein|nr:hypothetical protein [Ignavibacteria bacterium]MCU7521690.1 hypothetical protein [Ignavibacteria bacterium]
MKRIINFNPFKALAFAALFFAMSFLAFAQDDTARISVPPTPSIGQGQSNSMAQDTSFNRYAAQFAVSLAQQTGLSLDKSGKIRDVLMDYYNSITDIRRDFLRGMTDSSNSVSTAPNPDNTGSNRSANQTAIAQDLMSENHKADLKADKKILNVLDNDVQKNKYVQIKRQWWQKVKDVVYSTANQNSGGMQTR